MSEQTFDVEVAVIGGGAAGLAAAVVLGRALRSVTVIDAGSPRNAPAAGVHSYLTRDGLPPAEFVAIGRAEVEHYGGTILDGEVTGLDRTDDGFVLTLGGGDTLTARRVVLATGLVDELPDVTGLREHWGHDVIHCPFCHGYEVRGQRIGVLATNAVAAPHQAKLFRQLSDRVVVLRHTVERFGDQDEAELAALGIDTVGGAVTALESDGDRLVGARLASGELVELDAVVVAPRMVARSLLAEQLGLSPVPHPMGAETAMLVPTVDPTGRTEVPGLWIAGNVTEPHAQVIAAAAQGNSAGAAVNADLVSEDAQFAVAAHSTSGRRPQPALP